jgi:exonuclease III
MRIATWNVNSLRVRMEHLGRWLADNSVDAIALQELKLADEHFPRTEIEAMGLHALCYGQKTYNGVAILSRTEARECALGIPGDADPQRRVIAFRRDHGLRIDLMLAASALAARCTACTIDRTPRTWERPSDHAPVTAAFDIA